MNFEKSISLTEKLLDNFEFETASRELNALQTVNITQKRIKQYFWGKLLLRKGQFKECVECLTEALDNCGSHVSIHVELASAYYLLGDQIKFDHTLERLEEVYTENWHRLSYLNLQRTELAIAKFSEIRGNLNNAQLFYEKIVCHLSRDSKISAALCIAMAQLLRLEAEYFKSTKFKDLYYKLSKLYLEVFDKNFSFEIEHSLMLAEFRLCSPNLALQRGLSILKNCESLPEDHHLTLADLTYSYLIGRMPIPEALQLHLQSWRPSNFEDQLILNLAQGQLNFDYDWLLKIKKNKMTVSTHLRLLLLGRIYAVSEEIKTAYLKELNLMLAALDSESKATWANMICYMTRDQKVNLILDLSNQTLISPGGSLSLKNKKPALALCLALSRRDSIPNREAVQLLWESPWYDESYFHRLRMQVNRLKKALFQISSIDGALEIDSKQIKLNSNICIETRGDI